MKFMASHRSKRKLRLRTFFIGGVLLILIVAITAVSTLTSTAPADRNNKELITVTIVQGETANQIGARLKEEGIIKHEMAFKYYLKTHDVGAKLRAGSYQLSPSMTTEEIVHELLTGVGEMTRFTIPEGYTLRDIADLFEAEDIMTADVFWNLVRTYDISGYDFMEGCPNNDHRLEGFLFPDTYFIAKHTAPEKVIGMMLDRFQEVWEQMPQNKSGLSNYDTVILASMVESEAKMDDERSTIASVYYNRMEINMPMQCDATILYAMPERKTQLYYSDYSYESIYNTYLHAGLPPTPISNPGMKSLEAAFQPANTEYLYYLWDKKNNDGHVFAKTYDEHLKNRELYGY